MFETVIIIGIVLVAVVMGLGFLLYLLVPRKDPKLAELDRLRARPADVVTGEIAGDIADPVEAAEREAAALMQAGKKIEAVKVYRERTGVSLAEAKAAVERL